MGGGFQTGDGQVSDWYSPVAAHNRAYRLVNRRSRRSILHFLRHDEAVASVGLITPRATEPFFHECREGDSVTDFTDEDRDPVRPLKRSQSTRRFGPRLPFGNGREGRTAFGRSSTLLCFKQVTSPHENQRRNGLKSHARPRQRCWPVIGQTASSRNSVEAEVDSVDSEISDFPRRA